MRCRFVVSERRACIRRQVALFVRSAYEENFEKKGRGRQAFDWPAADFPALRYPLAEHAEANAAEEARCLANVAEHFAAARAAGKTIVPLPHPSQPAPLDRRAGGRPLVSNGLDRLALETALNTQS